MGNCKNIHIYFEQSCLCDEPITRAWLLFDVLNTCINLTLILEMRLDKVLMFLDAFDDVL
jgi:hypothetical protein